MKRFSKTSKVFDTLEENMKKNYTKGVAGLSLFTSFLCFIICTFFLEIKFALLCSLLLAFGLMIVIPPILYLGDRKYESIDSEINEDISYKKNVNFTVDGKARNGYFIISAAYVHFYSRDKKPYWEKHIRNDEVIRVELVNQSSLSIYAPEGEVYNIWSVNCKEIFFILKNKGLTAYIT
jgi:hypothetical protein